MRIRRRRFKTTEQAREELVADIEATLRGWTLTHEQADRLHTALNLTTITQPHRPKVWMLTSLLGRPQ